MLAASAACLAYNVLPRPASVATAATVAAAHAAVATVATVTAAKARHDLVAMVATDTAAPATAAPYTAEELIELTKKFLDTATGLYSPLDAEQFADDFIFRGGGVIGPLNKKDYLRTMTLLGCADAFDLAHNAFGFTVDPDDPMCVRFFLRNRGEHTKPWQPWGAVPPTPIPPTPGQTTVIAPTETARLVFNPDGRVKHYATGLVVGKYEAVQGESNTNGLGAVLGLFNAVGFGAVGGMALNKQVRDASNFAADQFEFLKIPKTKTNEEDVPAWWKE